MEPLTRKDAKLSGKTRFFTGKPCCKGHVSEKLVSNYKCVTCSTIQRYSVPERDLWLLARRRAKTKGIEFSLTVQDIKIPDLCPLLEIPLFKGTKIYGPNSPTLDRKDPNIGYTVGNSWVISHKANSIKSYSTLEEFELIAVNWKRLIGAFK